MQIKKVPLIVIALLVIVVGFGVWRWTTRGYEEAGTELILYGNTDIRQVELAFNGNERISTMLADEGAQVKKDQLLATLDTARLEPAVARAEAQVAAQREVVALLEAGTRPEDINKARADVSAATAEAKNAERNALRLRDLVKKNLASKEQADNARAAADAAHARLDAAKAGLTLALAGPRSQDIAAAKNTLKALEAELTLTQRALADSRLYAPDDGIIQDRILEPGDMVSPQRPVYTLALVNPVWIRTYITEPDLGKIRPGMVANISTDSFPGKTYRGWIGYISPTAQFTPKSVETSQLRTELVYQVRVYVCNPQNELRLGMPATVSIPLNQPEPQNNPEPCKTP